MPRIEANKSVDGRSLVVSMQEGPSIPSGETLSFFHDGLEGDLTLSESFAPGDRLYVGFEGTREDGEVVASRRPLDGDGLRSLRGDQTSLDGTVTLESGTVVSVDIDVGRIDWES